MSTAVLYIRCEDDLPTKLDKIVALRRKASPGSKLSRSDVARTYLHKEVDRELSRLKKKRARR